MRPPLMLTPDQVRAIKAKASGPRTFSPDEVLALKQQAAATPSLLESSALLGENPEATDAMRRDLRSRPQPAAGSLAIPPADPLLRSTLEGLVSRLSPADRDYLIRGLDNVAPPELPYGVEPADLVNPNAGDVNNVQPASFAPIGARSEDPRRTMLGAVRTPAELAAASAPSGIDPTRQGQLASAAAAIRQAEEQRTPGMPAGYYLARVEDAMRAMGWEAHDAKGNPMRATTLLGTEQQTPLEVSQAGVPMMSPAQNFSAATYGAVAAIPQGIGNLVAPNSSVMQDFNEAAARVYANDPNSLTGMGGQALGSALTMAPAAATGSLPMAAVFGASAAGGVRQDIAERRRAGQNIGVADEWKAATLTGIIEVLAEKVGIDAAFGAAKRIGTRELGALGRMLASGDRAGFRAGVLQVVGNSAQAGGVNALEEGLTQAGQNVVKDTYYAPETDILDGVGQAMAVGGLTGAAVAGVGGVANRLDRTRQQRAAGAGQPPTPNPGPSLSPDAAPPAPSPVADGWAALSETERSIARQQEAPSAVPADVFQALKRDARGTPYPESVAPVDLVGRLRKIEAEQAVRDQADSSAMLADARAARDTAVSSVLNPPESTPDPRGSIRSSPVADYVDAVGRRREAEDLALRVASGEMSVTKARVLADNKRAGAEFREAWKTLRPLVGGEDLPPEGDGGGSVPETPQPFPAPTEAPRPASGTDVGGAGEAAGNVTLPRPDAPDPWPELVDASASPGKVFTKNRTQLSPAQVDAAKSKGWEVTEQKGYYKFRSPPADSQQTPNVEPQAAGQSAAVPQPQEAPRGNQEEGQKGRQEVLTPPAQGAAPAAPPPGPGVSTNAERPIVASLKGDEIGTAPTLYELVRKAREWAQSNILNKTVRNRQSGRDIRIANSGIKKATGHGTQATEARVVPAIPAILADGTYVGTEPDREGRKAIKAFHYYEGDVMVGSERVPVRVAVREDMNGDLYYDHYDLRRKEKGPTGNPGLGATESPSRDRPAAEPSTDSIGSPPAPVNQNPAPTPPAVIKIKPNAEGGVDVVMPENRAEPTPQTTPANTLPAKEEAAPAPTPQLPSESASTSPTQAPTPATPTTDQSVIDAAAATDVPGRARGVLGRLYGPSAGDSTQPPPAAEPAAPTSPTNSPPRGDTSSRPPGPRNRGFVYVPTDELAKLGSVVAKGVDSALNLVTDGEDAANKIVYTYMMRPTLGRIGNALVHHSRRGLEPDANAVQRGMGVLVKQLAPRVLTPTEVLAALDRAEYEAATHAAIAKDIVHIGEKGGASLELGLEVPKGFTGEEVKRQVWDVVEGKAALDTLPKPLAEVAKFIRDDLDAQGREAANVGLLPADSVDPRQGSYIPYLYLNREAERRGISGLFGAKKGSKRLGLERTNRRLSDVFWIEDADGKPVIRPDNGHAFKSEADARAYLEKVAADVALSHVNKGGGTYKLDDFSPDAASPVNSDAAETFDAAMVREMARYEVRRPMTEEEKTQRGLIRDPYYAYAIAKAQMGRDIALARAFKAMLEARPDLFRDTEAPGFMKLPDIDREGKRPFGVLTGKYVHLSAFVDLVGMARDAAAVENLYDKALRLWKIGVTIYSPATHGRQAMSNLLFHSPLAGLNPALNPLDARWYFKAFMALRSDPTLVDEFRRAGILHSDFVSAELLRMAVPATPEARSPWSLMPLLSKAHHAAATAYHLGDEVAKTAAAMKLKARGATTEEAAQRVYEAFVDYQKVPKTPTMQMTKRILPFASFMHGSLRILGTNAYKRPATVLRLLATPAAASLASLWWLGLNGDDEGDKRERAMIRQAQGPMGRYFSVVLPWRDAQGRVQAWDLTRINPFADFIPFASTSPRDDEPAVQRLVRGVVTGSPFTSAAYSLGANQNAYTGAPVWDKGMTPIERGGAMLDYLRGQFSPGVLRSAWNIGKAASEENPIRQQDMANVVVKNTVGFDAKPVVPPVVRLVEQFLRKQGREPGGRMADGASSSGIGRRQMVSAALGGNREGFDAGRTRGATPTDGLEGPAAVDRVMQDRHPLADIPQDLRGKFFDSLSPSERREVWRQVSEFDKGRKRAVEWSGGERVPDPKTAVNVSAGFDRIAEDVRSELSRIREAESYAPSKFGAAERERRRGLNRVLDRMARVREAYARGVITAEEAERYAREAKGMIDNATTPVPPPSRRPPISR